MRTRSLAALALLASLLLAGCTTPEAYEEWYERRQGEADGVVVYLDGNEFVRQRIEVPVGTNVTWVNNGSRTHTVTFEDGSFDETLDEVGESVSRTFSETGTFDYRCEPHSTGYRNWDQMVGRVTVVEG